MSTAVIYPARPEQILKGLGKLWTSLAEEEKQQGKPTVLRASSMTLIVATDEEDAGFSASQTISELMHEHPSRGIVLAISSKSERDIEARVLAQCWKPFGKAQQICCEQIEITSRPESWPNIGPTLIGLTAPDLPVVFWCRHRAALSPMATRHQVAGLEAVMRLSTKTIVDTLGQDLQTALDLISEWHARGRVVADLEWARLTPWRQPIAQIFDNPARENGFSKFRNIEVAYSGETPCARVFYVAGWLSAPNRAKVSIAKADSKYGSGIQRISLHSDSEMIHFERTGKDCMTLRSTNGQERRYTFTDLELHTLMNEELSVVGPDAAFDAAFARALELKGEYR